MRRGASKREEVRPSDAARHRKLTTQTAIFLRLENFRLLILMGLTWNSNSRFAIRNLRCFGGFLWPTLPGAWAGKRGASCSSLIDLSTAQPQILPALSKTRYINSGVTICQAEQARWRSNLWWQQGE